MRWRQSASLLLTAVPWLLPTAQAVFADDAYQIDQHIALLGLPQPHTTFFHRPYAKSRASLLYTLSDRHVAGAINPKDGAIVWRHQLSAASNESNGFLRAGDGQNTVVSAVDGRVEAWAASDGKLVWSKSLGAGSVQDLEVLEMQGAVGANGGKDVLLLFTDGHAKLQRIDGDTGAMKWEYADQSGDAALQVSASGTELYLTLLHQTMLGGAKINVITIDPVTGTKVSQYSIASESDVTTQEQVLHVGANSAFPIIAWTDKSQKSVKANILGSKSVSSLPIENSAGENIESIVLHAPHQPNALAHFLVHVQTANSHWADVYHVDLRTSSITKAYSLQKLTGKGAFSCSSVDANVFFTRLTQSEMMLVSSQSHSIIGRHDLVKPLGGHSTDSMLPVQLTAEVAVASASSYPTRAAALLSNGEWVMIRNGEALWSRPEYLSSTVAATFSELSREQELVHELETESHQNALAAYIHRIKRHIGDLARMPAVIMNLPSLLLGTAPVAVAGASDRFGFRKVIVLALKGRRIVGLDSTRPNNALWFTTLTSSAGASDWNLVELQSSTPGTIQVLEAGLLEPLLIDTLTGQIRQSDERATTNDSSTSQSDEYSFAVHDRTVRGYTMNDPSTLLWKRTLPDGEHVVAVAVRPNLDPVASIGRALGDRRVLYKYLDDNVALIASRNDASGFLSVIVLNTVSGKTLFSTSHSGVDTSRPVAAAVSENWFAYSFTLDSFPTSSSRGQQLVINEMYESRLPNDRGPLGAATNYSSIDGSGFESANPHVISLTFHIPEEIEQMTVTQTRQGITSRDLIVNLADSRGIVGIPRQILDARRPVGRDPTTDEQAEGLLRYSPTLEFDPTWYLTHEREVMGVANIVTTPSLLESTCLVFAYGLDIFSTRVSPSFSFDVLGKGFNKAQMLLTVAALGVATLFIAPFVQRKQINQRWQIS